MASPVLGDLAGASGNDILVAFPAALGVVCWAKTVGERFNFFKNEPRIIERAKRFDIVLIDRIKMRALWKDTVCFAVKTGESFAWATVGAIVVGRILTAWHGEKLGRTLGPGSASRDEFLVAGVLFSWRLPCQGRWKNRRDDDYNS